MATRKKRVRKQVYPHARKRVAHRTKPPAVSLREKLTKYAEQDTPHQVSMEGSVMNLVIWAVGRFGIGIVFLAMTYMLYQDQRLDNEKRDADNERRDQKFYEMVQKNNEALRELTRAIDKQTHSN